MKVGILAIQGSFKEHGEILDKLLIPFVFVRTGNDLVSLSHLIIPGGESTTMTLLLKEHGMWEEIEKKIREGTLKLFGTCAGAILCVRYGLDITIDRNAYGAQQASFETNIDSTIFPNLKGVFIRAPRFLSAGKQVNILATSQGEPVLVQQGNMLASSFHPELIGETRVHKYFLEKV